LPTSRFDKAIDMARSVKTLLSPGPGGARDVTEDAERRGEPAGYREQARRLVSEQRRKVRSTKRELSQLRKELNAAKLGARNLERLELMKRSRKKRLELLLLKSELRAAKERRAKDVQDGRTVPRVAGGSEVGALPDFVVIGPERSGTSFFYRLLAQHPHVQPAAKKELHFFDLLFDEGIEWYRRWFPAPRLMDGRRTITGEATPTYIFHSLVPERIAKVIPQARLVALLRNPVDRTYSAYHHRARNRGESRSFEEVIEADLADGAVGLLSEGTYVDHLVRWSEFLGKEQLLVLKSENLFEHTLETLRLVFAFLDLPYWEPDEAWGSGKQGRYEEMDPVTRSRLEEYFEPHNRRLYEYLGVDLGW
jgi:hypothetical protein